jgi:type II secretory pathway pseudopilin PulG
MGQQQLLLVILVTIIVGIATVVAINTFGSAADSANLDAVRQDMASIAASAQGYYMKPTGLNGGGQDFTGMTFEDLAFGGDIVSDKIAENSNGSYELGPGASGEISLTAYPSSDPSYTEGTSPAADDPIDATIVPDNLNFDS